MASPVYEWSHPSADCQHHYQHRVPKSVSMLQDLGAVGFSWVRSEGSRLAWGVQEQLSSMSHLVSNLIPSTVYHYTALAPNPTSIAKQ